MAFMQHEVTEKLYWLQGEAKCGGTTFARLENFTPSQFVYDVLGYVCEDENILCGFESVEIIQGYGARLSAPGYMDCTEWTVFPSKKQAQDYLNEEYPEEPEETEDE